VIFGILFVCVVLRDSFHAVATLYSVGYTPYWMKNRTDIEGLERVIKMISWLHENSHNMLHMSMKYFGSTEPFFNYYMALIP